MCVVCKVSDSVLRAFVMRLLYFKDGVRIVRFTCKITTQECVAELF